MLCVGCTGSRWAKRDPEYSQKYPRHTDDPARVVKQAIDARHVAGRGGWFASLDGADSPVAGEVTVGRFFYPEATKGALETRAGLRGLAVEGGGVAGGVDLGVRLQAPSRLAPYVGVSGFVGAAPADYLDALQDNDSLFPDEEPHDTTLAAAISPEAGVHFWLSPAWRLSAGFRHTFADFDGPGHADYTTVGLSLAWLDVPGLRSGRPQPSPHVHDAITPAVAEAIPIDPASPYGQLLTTPIGEPAGSAAGP